MNRLSQKLSIAAILFVAFISTANAQRTIPKVETQAVLVMEDGSEKPGIMRMTSANYDRPLFQFHDEGKKKFEKLDTKGVERIILYTRDGNQHTILNFPVVIPKGRKKSQETEGNVMVMAEWKGENCVAGMAGLYYLNPKDGSLVIKYDKTFGTMLVFRDLRSSKGVSLGYVNPMKSEETMLRMNNMGSMMLAPYNDYFGEVCNQFLKENPWGFEREFDIEKFMNLYAATCGE